MIPAHVQSPCRPEQCEPFYDTREDPSRRWRSLGKVFLCGVQTVPRSESEAQISRKYDVTLYYCNDAFPIPLLQYLCSHYH